jgi:two-component system, NarL family, sensor histidine kinase BarA
MRRRMSIKTLILLMGLLPVLCLSIGLSAFLITKQLDTMRELMVERAIASADQLSIFSSGVLLDGNHHKLQELSRLSLQESSVRSITIYSPDMQPLIHAGPGQPAPSLPADGFRNISSESTEISVLRGIFDQPAADGRPDADSKLLGWVYMTFHWYNYELIKYQTFLSSVLIIGLAVIFAIAFVTFINEQLSRNLGAIRKALRKLATGTKNFHIHLPGRDGFSDIANELNDLNQAHQQEMLELQKSIEQSTSDLRETLETVEIQNIELDLARREAVEASRIKSEFLANTSHEIRTPLNGIIGFANILLKSELQSRQREAVETIRASADSLLAIINDILDFSKLEAGKLVLDNGPVSLREIAEDALIMQAPGAHEKKLSLALIIEEDVPDTVESDPLRLKQIFTNLISNAIKFTPDGRVVITISCLENLGDRVTLSAQVSDSGIGLSREQQKLIFRDFSQADTSVTRQYGGTGLGLVIVKRLVEQMGGEIGVDSEAGKGATFWFTLTFPVARDRMEIRQFNALSGRRVAVCDPDPYHSQGLLKLLTRWGLETEHTETLTSLATDCDYQIINLDYETDTSALAQSTDDNAVILCSNPVDKKADDPRIYLDTPVSHVRLFDALNKGSGYDTHHQDRHRYRHCKLLIVDDNPANLHILQNFLLDVGIVAETAQNGIEAIRICEEKAYDLILIDIQMPQLDGIEASRRIRQFGANTHTPIIAVSAYLAPENPAQLREAGVNEYISKPITESQLNAALQRFLPSAPDSTRESSSTDNIDRPVDIAECLTLSRQRPELARSMLGMLLDALPDQLVALRTAFQNKDWEAIASINHELKGGCCYTGVPRLKAAVSRLEEQMQTAELGAEVLETDAALFSAVIDAAEGLLAWRDSYDLEVIFQ